MHKRSMLWAGAGVLLLTNSGFGSDEAPDAPAHDEPLPVPLASSAADCPPAVPPPSRPRRRASDRTRADETP
jgi:hypothetical protein